jgi:hypothetical protein
LWAAAVVIGCNSPPDDSSQEAAEQRLVGDWLRAYTENGVQVRRLLVLEPGGKFHETSRVVDAQGGVTEHLHAGTWVYDGTNLKRKYTSVDGRQPSAPIVPFATFELTAVSRTEFTGRDNVRRREVRYERVAPASVL